MDDCAAQEDEILADLRMDNDLALLRRTTFPVVYRMVGSVAEAEDLIQEGLLRFQMATDKGTAVANPRAFLVSQQLVWQSIICVQLGTNERSIPANGFPNRFWI